MSPVHVLVSQRPEDEARYGAPFGGAVELYRFRSNVEAFERLTSASARVDVLILTPEQDAIFNMSADQLVERLVNSTLAMGGVLSKLRIVVVGTVRREHPRVSCVEDLDSAVRLIKFGRVESAPRAAAPPVLELQPRRPEAAPPSPVTAATPAEGSDFVGSLISAIWDAPVPTPQVAPTPVPAQPSPPHQAMAPAAAQAPPPQVLPVLERGQAPAAHQRAQAPHGAAAVHAGGPAQQQPAPPPQETAVVNRLFAHAHPQPGVAPARTAVSTNAPAVGPPAGLEPARPYVMQGGGTYRGPNARTGPSHGAPGPLADPAPPPAPNRQSPGPLPGQQPHGMTMGSPLPPGLPDQLRHIVYGQSPGQDPVLGWSADVQRSMNQSQGPPPAPAVVPGMPTAPQGALPLIAGQIHPQAQQHFQPHYAARPLPGQVAGAGAQPGQPEGSFTASPGLLARAEQHGDVSFG